MTGLRASVRRGSGTRWRREVALAVSGGLLLGLLPLFAGPAAADLVPPAPPTGLEGAAGDRAAGLTWTRSPEPDVAGYRLFRSTTLPVPVSGTPVGGTQTGRTYLDSGRTNAITYHYTLVAVDTSGNVSEPSPAVSVTPMAPAAATGELIPWATRTPAALARAEANGIGHGGKVYVFGGQYTGVTQTLRSDVYNPGTDTWTQIRDLPELITHAPVVADGNTLWLLGGYLGRLQKDSTTHVWKYDTVSNTYTAGPPLPAARGGGAAVIVGRTLHYLGGANRQDSLGTISDHADHWTLDLDGSGTWTPSVPVPNPRNHVAAVAIGRTLYVLGGQHNEDERTTPQRQVDAFHVDTGTWSRMADIPVPRGHISASTFVSGGKILMLGGSVLGAAASNTVYEYDPAADTWRTRTSLPEGRRSPVADLVGGSIVVSGGRGPGAAGPTTTTWIGSTGTTPPPPPPAGQGTWTTGPALPVSLLDAGGTELGGKIYVVGGKTSAAHQSTLRILDPTTGVWSTGAPLPGPAVENPAVVVHAGMLYAFGGSTAAFSGAVATGYRYDPAADTWTALNPMLTARGGAAAVVLDGAAWMLGGMDSTGASLTSTESYDFTTGTWTARPALATARDNAGAAALGGSIYVFGGRTRLASGTEVAPTLASTEALAGATASAWTSRASMPTSRRSLVAGVLGGKIVAAGGERTPSGGTYPQTEQYDPATNTWQAMAVMPTPRHGAAAAVVAGRLHTIGGGTTGGASFSAVHEVFTPPGATDTTPPAAPAGLAATVDPGPSVRLTWAAGTDADLAGYAVYRSTSTPVATSGTPVSGASLLASPQFTDPTVVAGTTYHYVVVAVDTTGNRSGPSNSASAVVLPGPASEVAVKVRFQDAASTPPAGYLRDSGQAFGARTGANQGSGRTYGWVAMGGSTPADLSANGRVRAGTIFEPRQVGLIHMQASTARVGNTTPASWELAVPDGLYDVAVHVGDAGNFFTSVHQINVEDQNAVAQFVPSDEDRFRLATRTVLVTDGRLTVSPRGGSNTKINYVEVASVPTAPARPRIASVTPANVAAGMLKDLSVTAGLQITSAGGIDVSTITSANVRLSVATDGSSVPGVVNTSGGGDVIVLTPDAPLVDGTTYRFDVTAGVRDTSGAAFHPWSSVFTVGSASGGTGIPGVAFDKATTPATGQMFTSITMGPDNKLYAATLDGYIFRYPVAADGSLGAGERIDTVRTNAGGPRTVIGLAFDPASTATNLILWVTENRQYIGVADVPDWTGKIVRLTGPALGAAQDVVINLPRSARDHESNSLAFHGGMLYLTQGSNSAMGAPDAAWEFRPERVLSAAVLRLDPSRLPATLPLDVKTEDGGTYDPFAPGAALTLYATGVRNAYDLLWHSNGRLYVPTNGSARGGNMPGTPAMLPASCSDRIDGPWTGPAVPAVTNNPVDETDWVFRVTQGGYYGHPNPARCEWSFNGGNPTAASDRFEATAYPAGVLPDRNYRIDDVFDAGLHASANGTIEYLGDAFGAALKNKLVVVRFSASQDIMVLDPSGTGGKIVSRTLGVTGFTGFNQPLDLAQHVASGTIYVTELGGGKITRLVPRTSTPPPPPPPPSGNSALFVAGALPLSAADQALVSRLTAQGLSVTLLDDGALTASSATGHALVAFSSTSASAVIGRLAGVTVPVITWENAGFDDLGMAPAGTKDAGSDADISAADPMLSGLSGRQALLTGPDTLVSVAAPAGATVQARLVGSARAVVWGFSTGQQMATRVAPARRVGLFLNDTSATSLTPAGVATFDAALRWARAG